MVHPRARELEKLEAMGAGPAFARGQRGEEDLYIGQSRLELRPLGPANHLARRVRASNPTGNALGLRVVDVQSPPSHRKYDSSGDARSRPVASTRSPVDRFGERVRALALRACGWRVEVRAAGPTNAREAALLESPP